MHYVALRTSSDGTEEYLPEMGGLDNSGPSLPRVEVDAGVVPLAHQLLGQLGMVVVVGVLGHIAWFPGRVPPPVPCGPPLHTGQGHEQHNHEHCQDSLV